MAQRRTADKQQAFLAALSLGHTKTAAAAIAGIDRGTPDNWEDSDSTFATALRAALGKAMAAQEAKVVMSDDWRAAAWTLERRNRDEWGKVEKLEHSGETTLKIVRE